MGELYSNCMVIIYTRHAKKRMAERRISAEEVRETIEWPDDIIVGDFDEETAIKNYGNQEIRVVYQQPDEQTYVIITVIKSRVPKQNGVLR